MYLQHNGDALAVFEHALTAHGTGPPLHVNPTLDASYHVLEGPVAFRLGDTRFTALPGASVVAPRRTPHTYANHTTKPVRVLVVCTPGVGVISERRDGPAVEAAPVHHSDIVGPPLAPLAAFATANGQR